MAHDPNYPRSDRSRTGPFAGLAVRNHERFLWAVVAVGLVGDLVSTWYGVNNGLTEANPVARSVLDATGIAGMALLKGLALGVATGCRSVLPDRYSAFPPATLAVAWTGATALNAATILVAT